MKLLLHCCCAPCALPLIEYLQKNTSYEIILFYSNSNIFPKTEYKKRKTALKKIAQQYQLYLIEDRYNHYAWLKELQKHLDLPLNNYQENSERCLKCFEFRIYRAINQCVKMNITTFATTLSVNRFKNTRYINEFSQIQAQKYHLKYYQFNLDPYESHNLSRELVKKYNIYSQKYCGCEFSLQSKYK